MRNRCRWMKQMLMSYSLTEIEKEIVMRRHSQFPSNYLSFPPSPPPKSTLTYLECNWKSLTRFLTASKAQILSNRELYIQSGSDINLTCIAPQAPGPYTHMLWYKDTELVSDSTRGGIRVVSEQQIKTSNLVISRVLHTDSGNYTCSADNSSECWPHKLSAHMSLISVSLSLTLPSTLLVLLFIPFQTPTASLCISLRANSTRPCSTNWACDWSCPICGCSCSCSGLFTHCHAPIPCWPPPKLSGNLCLMSALRCAARLGRKGVGGGGRGGEDLGSGGASKSSLLPRWDSQLISLLTLQQQQQQQQHLDDPSGIPGVAMPRPLPAHCA